MTDTDSVYVTFGSNRNPGERWMRTSLFDVKMNPISVGLLSVWISNVTSPLPTNLGIAPPKSVLPSIDSGIESEEKWNCSCQSIAVMSIASSIGIINNMPKTKFTNPLMFL
jgi:hypothetical protein